MGTYNVVALEPTTYDREIPLENPYELCAFLRNEVSTLVRSGMTYKAIATKAGITPTTVSKLHHGETKEPRASTTFGILRAAKRQLFIR